MYHFLPDFHNKVLGQIDPETGMLELDFADDDHYRFFLSQVGGLESFNQKYPHLASTLQELRTKPLQRSVNVSKDGYREGPEDKIAIENMIFHARQTLQTDPSLAASIEGTTMAEIMADYIEVKDQIVVVSQLYDVTNQMLLHTTAEDVVNSSKYKGKIQADYPQYFQDTPREFMIQSTFYCSNKAKNESELAQLKGYVTKSVGFTLGGNTDMIKSFTLNAPVIKESHRKDPNHTKVKISYRRAGAIPDYDYTNDDQPFQDGDNRRILVRVPFSVTVEAADRWWITGFDETYGYRMWLKNMVNGTINHYCNSDAIIQRKDAFDDQNRCTKMTFIFPESWNNILDFRKIENRVYTDVDFYSSFGVAMSCKGIPPITVGVSVKSDGKDYDKLNIQCAQIFIQWGCLARDTEILMADGTLKRADQIQIGERVRSAEGDSVQVKKVLTGHEAELYKISTSERSVRMTPDHIVCTEEGLLPAIDVQVGMRLRTVSGLEEVIAVEWSDYEDKVYNFEFEQETILIGNGLLLGDSMLQNRVKELVAYEA
ncbi:Hint domain-containing protein [Paenibacillus lentus]|uniref:Hint domain-containing protein n=1 Tax=Paenibacillus lentus TaxID=1338368 RepID=UPI00364BF0F6